MILVHTCMFILKFKNGYPLFLYYSEKNKGGF